MFLGVASEPWQDERKAAPIRPPTFAVLLTRPAWSLPGYPLRKNSGMDLADKGRTCRREVLVSCSLAPNPREVAISLSVPEEADHTNDHHQYTRMPAARSSPQFPSRRGRRGLDFGIWARMVPPRDRRGPRQPLRRHQVDLAELDALHAQDTLADPVDLRHLAAQNDDLKAVVLVQVDVQG